MFIIGYNGITNHRISTTRQFYTLTVPGVNEDAANAKINARNTNRSARLYS